MRILHTSDWHLGKCLESHSRLDEQRQFLEELTEIAEQNRADIIIVAGDVYDSPNPPAAAEQLFYSSMKKLSKNGARPVLIIAGNHDHPDRLSAAGPLTVELGVILIGAPKTQIPTGDYGHFSIPDSGEGFLEIRLNNESLVAITLPYHSEKRLNEIISPTPDGKGFQKNYSQKIGELFQKLSGKFRRDSVNIATGHFYLIGGETSKSERDIQLGGSYAVESSELPKNAQYIALGHLHRPQRCAGGAYYSGSPIQYDKSEANYAKCVYLADITPGEQAQVEKILLTNYKPIEIWRASTVEDAIKICADNRERNCWAYLEIKTQRVLLQSEIKEMRELKNDLVAIELLDEDWDEDYSQYVVEEKNLGENFIEFYKSMRRAEPTDELVDIFLKLCGDLEEEALTE